MNRWSLGLCFLLAALLTAGCKKPPEPSNPPAEAEVAAPNEFVGRAACAGCHKTEAEFCAYGAHRRIQCERCHGAGGRHARGDAADRPPLELGDAALCLSCHQADVPAETGVKTRIESFEAHLRDLEQDHRITLDREKSGSDCVFCHDPHLLE